MSSMLQNLLAGIQQLKQQYPVMHYIPEEQVDSILRSVFKKFKCDFQNVFGPIVLF